MTKRTKKSVGTRRRKPRTNFRKKTLRKKTLRNKKYRNRKTKRGGEGSDDEEEETKEESVAGITTGLRNLDVNNQGSSSSRDVDNITSGINNLNVAAEEEDEEECPICGLPFTDETNGPVITTTCGHKFHKMCLCKWCHRGTCPICRRDIRNTTCDQYCKYYLKIETISKAFSPQNPASNVVLLMLLEEMMQIVNPLRTTRNPEQRRRLEADLSIVKDAIKALLRNPALDLSLIRMAPPRRPINEIFVYIIKSEDDELIDLYLNKPNPGLTDKIIIDAKERITNMDKFNEVIQKMKNPQIRQNFPNVENFDKESVDAMFRRGLLGKDNSVMRQALNMPGINLANALCLMINEYKEGDDDEEDDDEEETKEEDIPENARFTGDSVRRLKEEIILDPEFDPFAMCTDINKVTKSILYTAILKDDTKTIDALLENPRLREGFTNFRLAELKENAFRSNNAENKALFADIIKYLKKNRKNFPNMNFSSTAFSIFTSAGGK